MRTVRAVKATFWTAQPIWDDQRRWPLWCWLTHRSSWVRPKGHTECPHCDAEWS